MYLSGNSGPLSATVTCSGQFAFFADSALYGTGDDTQQPLAVTIPPDTDVVAIECTVSGSVGGILASFGDQYLTDATWRCSRNYEEGWQGAGLDETFWQRATVTGQNGDPQWGVVPGVMSNAKGIWTSGLAGTDWQVYCRGHLIGGLCCERNLTSV